MLAVLRRQKIWFLPLLLLLPAILFGNRLSEAYYQKVERPRLLAGNNTAQACVTFNSLLPNKSPKSCDLALTEKGSDGATTEYFYFTDSSRLSHTVKDGRWRGSSAECTTAARLGTVAFLGFLLLGVSVLAHSLRTGQWAYWPGMEREPMNDFESVFGIYGAATVGAQLVSIASATCTAMALV
jgi:hypothetical protein